MSLNGLVVPYRSWNKIRNNGDTISAPIIDKIFGGRPLQASAHEPHLIATGSIFFLANNNSIIWGSGVLNSEAYLPDLTSDQIRAVRGRLSADQLVSHGVRLREVPFGDPGLLVSRLVRPTAGTGPRIAVVPHHDSVDHPFYATVAERDDVVLVDMLDSSLRPVEQIAAAEVVISQSLHGLVYAEALGKPCLWISHRSDDIWNFKFLDWYTTVYNRQRIPYLMSGTLDDMVRHAERQLSSVSCDDLLAAFPTELARPAEGRLIGYESCRSHDHVHLAVDTGAQDTPGATLEETLEAIRRAHHGLIRSWADNPYVIASLLDADTIPSPRQAAVITRRMDKVAHADYAVVVSCDLLRSKTNVVTELPGGVLVADDVDLKANVFVLRPSFPQNVQSRLVFGLP